MHSVFEADLKKLSCGYEDQAKNKSRKTQNSVCKELVSRAKPFAFSYFCSNQYAQSPVGAKTFCCRAIESRIAQGKSILTIQLMLYVYLPKRAHELAQMSSLIIPSVTSLSPANWHTHRGHWRHRCLRNIRSQHGGAQRNKWSNVSRQLARKIPHRR